MGPGLAKKGFVEERDMEFIGCTRQMQFSSYSTKGYSFWRYDGTRIEIMNPQHPPQYQSILLFMQTCGVGSTRTNCNEPNVVGFLKTDPNFAAHNYEDSLRAALALYPPEVPGLFLGVLVGDRLFLVSRGSCFAVLYTHEGCKKLLPENACNASEDMLLRANSRDQHSNKYYMEMYESIRAGEAPRLDPYSTTTVHIPPGGFVLVGNQSVWMHDTLSVERIGQIVREEIAVHNQNPNTKTYERAMLALRRLQHVCAIDSDIDINLGGVNLSATLIFNSSHVSPDQTEELQILLPAPQAELPENNQN